MRHISSFACTSLHYRSAYRLWNEFLGCITHTLFYDYYYFYVNITLLLSQHIVITDTFLWGRERTNTRSHARVTHMNM